MIRILLVLVIAAAVFSAGGCAGACKEEASLYPPLGGEEEIKSYSSHKEDSDPVADFCVSKAKSEGFKAVLELATKGLGGEGRAYVMLAARPVGMFLDAVFGEKD